MKGEQEGERQNLSSRNDTANMGVVSSFSDEGVDDVDDDDNEWDDDNNDNNDDETEDECETSFWDDVRSAWKQHFVACFVAVLATLIAFYYPHQRLLQLMPRTARTKTMTTTSTPRGASPSVVYPNHRPTTLLKHQQYPLHTPSAQHDVWMFQQQQLSSSQLSTLLHDYSRTNNISFCGAGGPSTTVKDGLAIMDFDVPDHLIPTLKLLYSDPDSTFLVAPNDAKTTTSSMTGDGVDTDNFIGNNDINLNSLSSMNTKQQSEINCIERQQVSSPQKYIKGVTYFYKRPTIDSMYHDRTAEPAVQTQQSKGPKLQASVLTFTGFAAKFVNMDRIPVLLHWDGRGGDPKNRQLIGEIAPFEALTTATRPGQSFSVSPVYDPSHALDRWVVTEDDAVHYYEPERKSKPFTETEQILYERQLLNQEFAKHYLIHSKRTWLAHFPRAQPIYHMWKAEYFGQKHIVKSTLPSTESDAKAVKTYTLEVASVTPRVFTIRNFLSSSECDALIELASTTGWASSTVYAGSLAKQQRDLSTRSSSNTWLARNVANLTDDIYRRAAQVLNIDESILQPPLDEGFEDVDSLDLPATHHSLAESLQVIRYREGEEYAPHHDWVIPSQRHPYQPTRFATLLLYLNDDYTGGKTTFPRAVNAQYHEGITIQPKKGTAVLFYNVLSDGNVDDLSIHGSEKITKGVKYAANLWLWEPVIN